MEPYRTRMETICNERKELNEKMREEGKYVLKVGDKTITLKQPEMTEFGMQNFYRANKRFLIDGFDLSRIDNADQEEWKKLDTAETHVLYGFIMPCCRILVVSAVSTLVASRKAAETECDCIKESYLEDRIHEIKCKCKCESNTISSDY